MIDGALTEAAEPELQADHPHIGSETDVTPPGDNGSDDRRLDAKSDSKVEDGAVGEQDAAGEASTKDVQGAAEGFPQNYPTDGLQPGRAEARATDEPYPELPSEVYS